jgi:uncharacterized protein YecT (DUF1311 family)
MIDMGRGVALFFFARIVLVLALASHQVHASDDDQCPNQGGGRNDHECYAFMIKRLEVANIDLLSSYAKSIKLKFTHCNLVRNGQKPIGANSDHTHCCDVIYAECAYRETQRQNDFLRGAWEAWYPQFSTMGSSPVRFDYKNVESSQKFFSGRTDVEITQICNTGSGGTVAISFCAKKDFEKIDGELQQALAEAVQRIEVNDGELRSAQLPVALPLFLQSQMLWEQHRDAACYSAYRSLGAASDRYAEF